MYAQKSECVGVYVSNIIKTLQICTRNDAKMKEIYTWEKIENYV